MRNKPRILKKSPAKKSPEFGFCFRGHGGKALNRKRNKTGKVLKKLKNS
jgi:hypothetical protein